MKIAKYIFFTFFLGIFVSSCQKKVVPEDLYGYWRLENDVKFEGKAFTLLLFENDTTGEKCSYIDPVINDSIYCYNRVSVDNGKLVLVDIKGNVEKYNIKELCGETLVISDFPGADKSLRFKLVEPAGEFKPLNSFGANRFPKDSLDVIIKSERYFSYMKTIGEEAFVLSRDQMLQARDLLRDFIDNKKHINDGVDNDDVFPLDEYVRQYTGIVKDGEVFVDVTMNRHCCSTSPFLYTGLKAWRGVVEDGGPSHARAGISLKQKKVWLITNGPHDPFKYKFS